MKLWILTSEYNLYDQQGAYFEAAWVNKPSIEQLKKVLDYSEKELQHILSGGSRVGDEEYWYHLTEVKEGERA